MANRLANEDSPYLQQHKDNPVNWYPWCDEAFLKANAENKAIFISIGYSSCHWCHVMEEQVFEDQTCAEILNEHFICIKVDREERPDIDKHYQELYQLLNRRAGGWPTSIFATPQNKPFFAGTYIPAESNSRGIEGIGFKELTQIIASKISQKDGDLFKNADEIEGFIQQIEHPNEATVLKESFIKNFILQAQHNFDTKNGGFSPKPKFPHASTLNALLSIDRLYDEKSVQPILTTTLNAMKKGGMYDLVDGGFCRYSTDNEWLVPHFEKMLYDNALLCGVYTQAYLTYEDESYLSIAKECADFWENFMSEDALFYSASDADSEGQEGTYFVYTYDEVFTLLTEAGYEDVPAMCTAMNVSVEGNFEGKNIISFQEGCPAWFADIKPLLAKLRTQKVYPFIDKKIQTSWSAMMIHALFTLGAIDAKYQTRASQNLNALLNTMYKDSILYHTTLIHKEPKIEAFLEDYAFLVQALLSAFKYTNDEIHLINAQRLTNKSLELFYKDGLWNFSVGEFVTKAESTDNTYTSSVSVMIDNMLTLGVLLGDDKYTHFAFKTLEYNSYELGHKPILYPYMLTQALRYLKGERIIKSTQENLMHNRYKLAKLHYPFIQHKVSQEQEFLVCGEKSCFATTSEVDTLDTLIANSF